MKKIFMIGIVIASACSGVAAPQTVRTGDGDHYVSLGELSERRALLAQKRMESFGGMIARPGSQKGKICFINCQEIAPSAWIEEIVHYFADETKFKIELMTGEFSFNEPVVNGCASLFVIDDSKLPVILVAPENRWALINIRRIANEKRPAFFESRVKKQLARSFALLCGASNSQYPNSLTRGIVNESDLDKNFDYRLPVDVVHRFRTYMDSLGVKPEILIPYRKACQEGWAPAPTNEHQKVVWQQVHEKPSDPLKITFDPKTDTK